MALTAAQIRSIHEILEVPYSDSYGILDHMGLTECVGATADAAVAAKTAIATAVAALGADSETKVSAIVTEWDALGFKTMSLVAGQVGDVGGMTYDLNERRDLLRQRLQIYLPFYKLHEILERKLREGGLGSNVLRTLMG